MHLSHFMTCNQLRWREVRRVAVLLRVFGDNPLLAEFNDPLAVLGARPPAGMCLAFTIPRPSRLCRNMYPGMYSRHRY